MESIDKRQISPVSAVARFQINGNESRPSDFWGRMATPATLHGGWESSKRSKPLSNVIGVGHD